MAKRPRKPKYITEEGNSDCRIIDSIVVNHSHGRVVLDFIDDFNECVYCIDLSPEMADRLQCRIRRRIEQAWGRHGSEELH